LVYLENGRDFMTNTVTSLGEFSAIGRLASLGSFLIFTEVAQNSWPTFLRKKSSVLILTNKRVGQQFGRFFQKVVWSP
jgi:hypothetical protein